MSGRVATAPPGEIPTALQDRRRGADVRRAIERRFASDPNEHGEGAHTAEVADKFVAAVLAGDKPAVELLRSAIAEVCGPPRQGVDISARVYSVVKIVGDDDDEDEPSEVIG